MRFNQCTIHSSQLTIEKEEVVILSERKNLLSVIPNAMRNLRVLVEVGEGYGI